ncbi:MAG: AAA family ATPase [Erysipelotrichaceae bacterium]|nr:AAA family ATPase [Erysipelotrichaceae bacterium]
MRLKHVSIKNFRGIKQADLTFPDEQRLVCLIGPGDSTKSTILRAIHYALWPSWNLSVSSSDFYDCNTDEQICIEVSFDEFPDSFLKEQKYGLYLRGSWNAEADEPTETNCFLTARLIINDSFEPQWSIVCKRQDDKAFSTADRQMVSPGMIGIDFSQNLNWGQGSALSKYVDPRETIKKNLSIIEAESRKLGDYSDLDAIAPIIAAVADGYGVSIDGELNNKVSLKTKNVLSTIELFEGSKPFNQRGYGSKKLINLGLQIGDNDRASILLIDEIEIGLEPYRQKSLIHRLKKEVNNGGQVLFTTHSTVVLAELDISQLILVNSEDGVTTFRIIANENAMLNSKMQGMLRRIPDAFLTPRILVCEGITEVGFIRALDEKLQENEKFYMASRCVSYADGKGSAEALAVAERFHDLGFDVAVLIDNDRPEDENKKNSLISKGVSVFSWEEEQCIETALLPLFSVETLGKLLQWESEKKDATWDEIIKQGFAREKYILGENANLLEIAKICSNKEFFKRVAGGEELGKMFFEKISGISPDSAAVKTVNSIVSWINYGEELGLSK